MNKNDISRLGVRRRQWLSNIGAWLFGMAWGCVFALAFFFSIPI